MALRQRSTYGEVFRHIADENYVCAERTPMAYVLRLPGAYAIWGARYLLLVFLNRWLGGTLLALLFTATAWLIERSLPARHRGEGWGWLPPLAVMAWCVADGFDLYLRTEPSTFVLRTVALLGAAAVLAGGCALWRRFSRSAAQPPATQVQRKGWRRLLLLLPVAAYAGGFALRRVGA